MAQSISSSSSRPNRVSTFVRKAKRALSNLRIYDVIRILIYSYLKKEKELGIVLKNHPLRVRSATSDVVVAFSCLVDKEFSEIESKDVNCIVDAGAYIGVSALALSEQFPNAKVYALEPEPSNFKLLVANTTRNPKIIPMNVALDVEVGHKKIFGTNEKWGFSIVEGNKEANRQDGSLDTECISMEAFMNANSLSRVNILKMDIEGSEKQIFQQSSAWIDLVDVLVVELHDRLVPGCLEAFENATKKFTVKKLPGEKYLASRT